MDENGDQPPAGDGETQTPAPNGYKPAEPDKDPPQSDEQARLTAWLCLIVLLITLAGLAALTASIALGRTQTLDESPEWMVAAWLVETADGLKAGLSGLLILVTLAVGVATKLYRNGKKLRILFGLILASGLLALFLLFATTRLESARAALDYFVVGPGFDFTGDATLSDRGAQVKREAAIADATAALWYAVLAWLASALGTVLGINSKPVENVRKAVEKAIGGKGANS